MNMSKLEMDKNILLGCTGSVASMKIPELANKLLSEGYNVRIVVTEHSQHFFNIKDLNEKVQIFNDAEEWSSWKNRGDPVLHIELGKWAHVFLIAPLDANTLAKLAMGLCDNLLSCVSRAWDSEKPLIFCPAMNTRMYQHPATVSHISILKQWGYLEVPVVEKTLICGDKGLGAMAEVNTIVEFVNQNFYNKK